MKRENFIDVLNGLGAGRHIMDWILKTPGTPEELWNECRSPAWMEDLLELCEVSFHQQEFDVMFSPTRKQFYTDVAEVWQQYDQEAAKCALIDKAVHDLDQKLAPLQSEYCSKWADTIRSMVSFSDIEKALAVLTPTSYRSTNA